jgi:Na+-translocating ferredoxin:NAD+ oxidoreductase subunit G
MRTPFKIILRATAIAAVGLFGLAAGSARGDSAMSPRSVLAGFFPASEKVTYKTFDIKTMPTAERTRLVQRLGYSPKKDRYTIFVAETKGHVDGFAIIDDEAGQHLPITFATKLSPDGTVQDLEVMVYREPRGDEIRDARFRKQFSGKTARDRMAVSHDIDVISGATISCVSMTVGVKRAAVLVEELMLGKSTFASARPDPKRPSSN